MIFVVVFLAHYTLNNQSPSLNQLNMFFEFQKCIKWQTNEPKQFGIIIQFFWSQMIVQYFLY